MPSRTVMSKQAALKLASGRRRQLDRERGEQDKRIEAATAETLVALQVRDDAKRALDAAQAEVGESLRRILAEDVGVDRAAALLDIDVTEARRLLKTAPADAGQGRGAKTESSVAVMSETGRIDSAARRGQ